MTHHGDITGLAGGELAAVDVVTGGSPCQDLSIAGRREGLAGARSGLFMEQIRIIREMRDADERTGRTNNAVRPRFMVWENVFGAFSSNKGEDFRIVLEETARVKEPGAVIPRPPKGKWRKSGCVMGDGWSIAWRVLDARFWGVPQRRRRITLVADFGGQSAPEILFVRESVRGDIETGGTAGAAAPGDASSGVNPTGGVDENGGITTPRTLKIRSGCEGGGKGALVQDDLSATLSCNNDQTLFAPVVARAVRTRPGASFREDGDTLIVSGFKAGQGAGAGGIGYEEETAPTLMAANCGLNRSPAVMLFENHAQDSRVTGPLNTSPTVSQKWGTGGNNTPIVMAQGSANAEIAVDLCTTLICAHEQPIVNIKLRVRRLTPLECERLQGYPDRWTDLPPISEMTDDVCDFWRQVLMQKAIIDGKARWDSDKQDYISWRTVELGDETVWECTDKPYKHKTKPQMVRWYNKMVSGDHSDSARYRALGNSIALPPWKWVLKRISACYERDATLGSLFDGIGGFPFLWEQINGKGSCLWSSEIDPFCIAVTQARINTPAE